MFLTSVLACSQGDDMNNGTGKIVAPQVALKLKTIVEERYSDSGTDTISAAFKYYENEVAGNEGKLSNIRMKQDKKFAIVFEYSGDKIRTFQEMKLDLIVMNNNLIAYNEEEIARITVIPMDGARIKKEYSYENNGDLKKMEVFEKKDEMWELPKTWEYTFENDNLKQLLAPYGEPIYKKKNIQYDDKKNPLNGMSPYLKYALPFFEGFEVFAQNNVLKQECYNSPYSSEPDKVVLFDIQYNSEGYPTEIRKVNDANQELLSKTTITYN